VPLETIQWASSQWRERTDANFFLLFGNDTADRATFCGGASDGLNQVDVTGGCLEPACTTWAVLQPYVNSNSDMVEADLCVFRPGATTGGQTGWAITTPIAPMKKDLIGLLVHEFGHMIGLDHTANTVMDSPSFGVGNTRARYPYGDDIDCSYPKWGSVNCTRYVSKLPPQPATAFQNPQQVGGGSDAHFTSTAAVGADNSGQAWFVSGALHPNFNFLRFTRTQHPVTASPTWQGSLIGGSSRRPPSIASRPIADSVHLWGAAWTNEEQTAAPNGMTVAASSDMFQTVSSIKSLFDGGLGGSPASFVPQEPALFYDSNTQRWGILFVRSDGTFDDELFATTSTDLVNWTPMQDLGFQTLDAPSASCVPFSYCTATFLKSYVLDPTIVTKSFTINPSTGAIVWGSSRSSAFSPVPRNAGITASRSGVAGQPSTQMWLMAITREAGTSIMDLSMPKYRIYARMDIPDPPGIYGGDNFLLPGHPGELNLYSNHRANIVSDPWAVDWSYIISTR
jgi:hypothetical protein